MKLPSSPGIVAVVALTGAALLQGAASNLPGFADAYARLVGPLLSRLLTGVTRWVPVSLADFVEVGAAVVVVAWIVSGARRVRDAEPPRSTAAKRVLAEGFAGVGVVYLGFLLLWGIGYGRPGLAERLDWTITGDDERALRDSAEELVEYVNALYVTIHGSDDGGSITGEDVDPRTFDAALRASWEVAGAAMGMTPYELFDRGDTKPLLSSPLYSRLLIAGIYFPFTGEANINMEGPVWQQPLTRAHEMAHQRFFYDEADANFAGFLVCAHANDPQIRYSAWLFAQRQTLRQLQRIDPDAARALIDRRHPGVQADVTFSVEFWRRHRGKASIVSQAVNDAYLKSQGVHDGVRAYGRSVRLLQYWLGACGGAALCDPVVKSRP